MLERFPITTFFAPPTAYRMFVQEPLAQVPVPDAAPLHRRRRGRQPGGDRRVARGHRAPHLRGATARPRPCCSPPPIPAIRWKPGSMGLTAPGHTLGDRRRRRPRAAARRPRASSACACGPSARSACSRSTGATRRRPRSCHRGDWYVTGDRATMDEDGYLWFVGRADDVINSASYRIGPFEVESALVEHPAVAEAAVIGKPDAAPRRDRQGVRRAGARPRGHPTRSPPSSRST